MFIIVIAERLNREKDKQLDIKHQFFDEEEAERTLQRLEGSFGFIDYENFLEHRSSFRIISKLLRRITFYYLK